MRKPLLHLVLACAAVLAFAQIASADLITAFTFDGRVGVEVAAFPSAEALPGSGTFLLTAIPAGATIERAFLYTDNWFSGPLVSATFAGNSLGAVAPFSSDDDVGGSLYAYRWDVTGLISGNGRYSASFGGANWSFGMALWVVFTDPTLPFRRIVVNDGAEQVASFEIPNSRSTTFDAVAGAGSLWIYTQADDDWLTAEQIRFNGSLVGGPIDANLGDFASLFNLPITAANGLNTAEIYSTGDWMGWQLAVLDTPSAIPEPGTLVLLLSGVGAAALLRRNRK